MQSGEVLAKCLPKTFANRITLIRYLCKEKLVFNSL
nr:MAG TPA: hypothetical protein [Caudoviricetes sp.]